MLLRKLEKKDAPLMLEWMHDDNVTQNLKTNFATFTTKDVESFINASVDTSINMHLAIVSDADEYMGTVSLKNIDRVQGSAEFAIAVRKTAMSRGYAWFGMTRIINVAFKELGLSCVYWCVSKKNERAIRFYEKNGFKEITNIPQGILDRYYKYNELKWYSVLAKDDYTWGNLTGTNIIGCKIINMKTISTNDTGALSFFEGGHDIPFEIKRVYYIYKVPEGGKRGFHAHKNLKQLIFCPYGIIQLILDDGKKRERITLCDPSVGIIISSVVWREMLWIQKDSVLCVAASDYFEDSDYLRNYDDFIKYVNGSK